MKHVNAGMIFTPRMKRATVSFVMCAMLLIASQNDSHAQWKQCKGFSNAIGNNNVDDVTGFLAVGNYLLADAKCGYNQSGATPDSLFQSTDNGQTWVSYSANGGLPLAAIGNDLIGCVTLPSSAPNTEVLSYSSDKGRTWHTDTSGWPSPDASAVTLLSVGSTIYMSCGMSGIYQQTAPGARWTPDTAGMTIAYQGVLYTYPVTRMITLGNTIFAAAGFNAGIYISTNKGASWSKADNGLPNIDTVTAWLPTWAFAVSGQSVFALIPCDSTDNTYDCYCTTNNGQSWTKMTSAPQTWSNITPQLAAIGQNLFAATDSGLYVSTNSGGTWKQWNKGLPTANGSYINAITISGGNVVVSTFENGVWYRKLSDFGISSAY